MTRAKTAEALMAIGVVLAACACSEGEPPPPPRKVALGEIDPCTFLSADELVRHRLQKFDAKSTATESSCSWSTPREDKARYAMAIEVQRDELPGTLSSETLSISDYSMGSHKGLLVRSKTTTQCNFVLTESPTSRLFVQVMSTENQDTSCELLKQHLPTVLAKVPA